MPERDRRQRLRRGSGLRPAAEVAAERSGLNQGAGQQRTAQGGARLRPAGEVAGEQAAARLRRQQAKRNAPLGPYEQALNIGEAQLRSAVPATKGAVAGAFGYEDYAEEQAAEATRIQQEAAAEGPPIMQASDVEGWSDVPQFVGQNILAQGPNVAATTAGAVAGGGVTGLARRGLRRGVREAARREAARELGKETGETAARSGRALASSTQTGAMAGAGTAEATQITAETFPRFMNDEEARENYSTAELSRRALLGAGGSAVLGLAPVANVLNRTGLSGAARKLQQGVARRTAGAVGSQAAVEGATETAQQALMRGLHSTVNENIEVFDDEGLKELFNAGAAGAVVGGATGVPTGLVGDGSGSTSRRRTRRQGPIGRARAQRKAQREAKEADRTVARKGFERLQKRAPELATQITAEGEGSIDFGDEGTQRRIREANLRFSRNVDPRGEMQFDERMDSVASELIGQFTEEALALRSNADRLINEQPEGADATTRREDADTRRRTAERLDAEMGRIEGVIERLQRAREEGDAEAFINQALDSIIDGDITLDDRTVETLTQAFEPFRAQFTDIWRLRQAERGDTETDVSGLDMSDLDSGRREDEGEAPNPFQVMGQDEFDVESEVGPDPRTPGALREQETGKVRFIGQSTRGGRTNPWVARDSMMKTVPPDKEVGFDPAQKFIRRMKEQYGRTDADDTPNSVSTPEGYFERVPFRRVVEAEYLNEQRRREADPNRDLEVEADREELADLEDQLAQGQQAGTLSEQEQDRLIERIDRTRRRIPRGPRPDDPRPVDAEGNPEAEDSPLPSDLDRYLAERGRELQRDLEATNSPRASLYDPDDPAKILDEFVVIRHTETPPQFGQEDPTALTPQELWRATHRERKDLPRESDGRYQREKLRRNEDGELPRGSVAAVERTYLRHGETLDDQINRMEKMSRDKRLKEEKRAAIRERINTALEAQAREEDAEPGSYLRDADGDRILLEEEEVIYNVQEAANAIRDRLPDREDVQAGSDAREIEVAWEALSSIANQPGKDVELKIGELKPNDVLMTRSEKKDPATGEIIRPRREITWREMRRTGAARLRAQLENLKHRADQGRSFEGEDLEERIRVIEGELEKARRSENRERTQEDIAAREVLAEPLEYSEEDVQWARDHLQARAEQHAEAMSRERGMREPGERSERTDDGVTASVDAERRRVQDRAQRIAEINQRLNETHPDLMGELRNIIAENERLVGELREAGTPIDRLRGLSPEPSAIRSLTAEDNERISLALAELGQRGDELSENHERMQAIEEELNLDPQARELINEREQLREANLEDQARIREQEQAAANVDAQPTDRAEQPVNVGENVRRPQEGDSPAGTDEDTRPERRRQAGDQTFTAVGRERQRMLAAERAVRRLRGIQPHKTRFAAKVFRETLDYDTAFPDDVNEMIAEAGRARDRYQQQVWDRSVAERQEFMEKALRYASVEDARNQFHQVFGERLPSRATIAEIRERVEQASELKRQARAQPSQLQDEQNMVQEWARRLNIASPETLRVVGRDEIASHVEDVDLADLMSGAINGVHVVDANGDTLIHVRDGLTREARVEVLAHELGHVVYAEHIRDTSEGEAHQMWEAFNKWRTARNKPRAEIRTAVTAKQALNMAGENLAGMRNYARVRDMGTESRQDLFDFEEWFADNTARWLTQTKEPRTVIERFFKRVADSLKTLFEQARKPRKQGGQNLSYRAEKNVAGFLRRMWNKTPAQIQAEAEGRSATEEAHAEMPVDDGAVEAVRSGLTIGERIDDDAFIRSVMGASYAQHTDPHSTGAALGYSEAFELLTPEERATLGRAFMRPEIRAQMEHLIDDIGTMHSIDNGNVPLAMKVGYRLWMEDLLELNPRADTILQKLYHKLAEVFGIVTERENRNAVFTALHNGVIAAREQSNARIGEGVIKRFRQQNRLQETAAKAVQGFDLAIKPLRWAYGAQSRIFALNNPVLNALTQEFQPRPGTERNAQGMYEARNAMRGIFHSRVFKATENLTAEQGETLLKMLQGDPDTPLAPEGDPLRTAYDETRRLLDDMRRYAVSRGVNMGFIEDYWPQVMDLDTLESRHAEFINLLSQEKFNDELQTTFNPDVELRTLSQEERVHHAESIYDALMKHDGYADTDMEVQDGNNVPALGAAHQRKLAWVMEKGDADDQRQFISFQKQDIGEILAAYTEQIIKRSEWTSRFGNSGERLEKKFQQARELGATEKDIELTKKYVNAMMGTHGRELAPILQDIATTTGKWFGQDWSNLDPAKFRKFQGVMMVYQNIRVLGLATLTSIADTGGIIVRSNDLGTAMQAFRQGLREITLGIKQHTVGRGRPRSEYQSEMRRLAETMGTIDMHMVNEVLGESYGGLYLTGRSRQYNEKFFKLIQLQRWTQFSRIMSLAAGKTFLLKHRDGAYSEHSERFLQQLNLKPEDIRVDEESGDLVILSEAERRELSDQRAQARRELAEIEEGQADTRGTEGDAAALRAEIDDLRNELLRDSRIRTALNRYVDESVMRPNPAQRPIWASHPDAQLLFHLKQFAYAIHNQITRRILTEAGQGNYWPLLAATSYIPIMIAADLLREDIQYDEDGDPRKRHWDAWDYVKDGIHRSGMTGLGTFLLDAHKDRTQFGGVGYESLQGPTITQMRDIGDYLINGDGEGLSIMADAMPANSLWSNWDLDMTQIEEAPEEIQRGAIGSWRN